MLTGYFALLLALGVTFVSAASRNMTAADLQVKLVERCRKNSPNADAAIQEVTKEMGEFKQTVQLSVATLMTTGNKKKFCADRSSLVVSLQEFANTMEQCLPNDEKYLKSFIPESFSGLLDVLCENDGKSIDELTAAQMTCMKRMEISGANKKLQECFNKIVPPSQETLKKSELCDDLNAARKCLGNALAENCPEAEALQSMNTDVWDAISHPCSLADSLVANFLVMLLAFFATKLFT